MWTCFHCSETFADRDEAALHFGSYRSSYPICQVDSAKYREMESEVESWRNECAPLQKEAASLHAQIAEVRIRSEEAGYARGLADAKKHPEVLGLTAIPDWEGEMKGEGDGGQARRPPARQDHEGR